MEERETSCYRTVSERDNRIVELYANGNTARAVAAYVGVSTRSVWRALRRWELAGASEGPGDSGPYSFAPPGADAGPSGLPAVVVGAVSFDDYVRERQAE